MPRTVTAAFPIAAIACVLAACSTPSDVELMKGNEAMTNLDFRTAAEHYDEAIRLDPDQTEAYFKRGRIRWQGGQYKNAIPDFDRAIELQPSHMWAHFFRGASHMSLRQYEQGIADFDLVTASTELDDDDQVRAYTWRAIAHYHLNRFEESAEDHSRCIAIRPDAYVHRLDRAWVYEVMKRYDDAIADYEQAITLIGPDSVLIARVEQRLKALRAQADHEEPAPTSFDISD